MQAYILISNKAIVYYKGAEIILNNPENVALNASRYRVVSCSFAEFLLIYVKLLLVNDVKVGNYKR